MTHDNASLNKAMRLAVVTGLRAALGPALLAAARHRPERQHWALAALGEMAFDKLPFVPSRASLPMLVPRALAGAWVTRTILEEDGAGEDPWAPALGAAVAVGVATFAPRIRGTLRHLLGVPDFALGIAEDYLAIRLGSEALGLTIDDVREVASDSVSEVGSHLLPAAYSTGAGSM